MSSGSGLGQHFAQYGCTPKVHPGISLRHQIFEALTELSLIALGTPGARAVYVGLSVPSVVDLAVASHHVPVAAEIVEGDSRHDAVMPVSACHLNHQAITRVLRIVSVLSAAKRFDEWPLLF